MSEQPSYYVPRKVKIRFVVIVIMGIFVAIGIPLLLLLFKYGNFSTQDQAGGGRTFTINNGGDAVNAWFAASGSGDTFYFPKDGTYSGSNGALRHIGDFTRSFVSGTVINIRGKNIRITGPKSISNFTMQKSGDTLTVTVSTPVYKCSGTDPSNASLCPDDDQNIMQDNLSKVVVASCTDQRKCEYTCNQDFEIKDGQCTRATCGDETPFDTNEDGKINVIDLSALRQYLIEELGKVKAEEEVKYTPTMDVNKDCDINVLDYSALLAKVKGELGIN